MAKRYFSFQVLSEKSAEQCAWKIPGTLGSHFMILRDHEGYIQCTGVCTGRNNQAIVDGLNAGVNITPASETQTVNVWPGQTLGYNCGQVWVVPDPTTVKDPLRRVMLELKLPKEMVVWVSSPGDEKFHLQEMEYFQKEGCRAFYSGEEVHYADENLCVVKEHTLRRPIDQLVRWSKIFVISGTPREEVARVIREVMSVSPTSQNPLQRAWGIVDAAFDGRYKVMG
ncbi:MAG: hypothetical protein QG551_170 [Patescibacteria group bacterium]|nr:hypothetical protein [Patescibacteria group bacterium]